VELGQESRLVVPEPTKRSRETGAMGEVGRPPAYSGGAGAPGPAVGSEMGKPQSRRWQDWMSVGVNPKH